MASIFRATYAHTDPKTGKKTTKACRKWRVEYRGADGIVRRVTGYTDLAATKQLAARLERDAARGQEGMIDPYADPSRRPLVDHLADYRGHLEAKDDAPRHVAQTCTALRAVLDGCGFLRTADLSGSRLAAWLAERRGQGTSARTFNYYLTAAKGFTRWLVRDRRTSDDPFAYLARVNEKTDRRRVRRDISEGELAELIDAAGKGEPYRGLSGADRAMLYTVATFTGYRCAELASLSPASFSLDGDAPTVVVEAAYAKNARADTLPVCAALADLLRPWLAERPADEPLWPGTWRLRAAAMLRVDLAAARRTWIDAAGDDDGERQRREQSTRLAYRDAAGRVFDFHATRGQFISSLARSGVPPRTAQLLARHSDVNLTMNAYTHLGMVDLSAAVDALPSPSLARPSAPPVRSVRATGTDSTPTKVVLHVGQHVGPAYMRTHSEASARIEGGKEDGKDSLSQVVGIAPDSIASHPAASKKESAPCRNRTDNLLIKSQLLYRLS